MEGLPTSIGVAKSDSSRTDFVYDEDAPMIFTGPFELRAYRDGRVDSVETEQLACRLQYIFFRNPTPGNLGRKLKHCATCWSRWVLCGELQWRQVSGIEHDEFTRQVVGTSGMGPMGSASSSCSGPMSGPTGTSSSQPSADLASLVQWRQQGILSDEEFTAAKRRCLGLH